MTFENTKLNGVYIINNFNAVDDRGLFVKTFNKKQFQDNNIDFDIRESYYSISNKNVIRGMHFQLPPHDHEKLVYVVKGSILDVIVDLRKNSKTYKQHISINLSEENKKSIFIPKGLAHGFKSIKDGTITVYNVASEYNADFDSGIKFDSFNFNWNSREIVMSNRDKDLQSLDSFYEINPF
jgi:dTDP-4-dehydrorhamnose 3,5-epimerase/CDP-3, 6-dideoxy-D-glycero-D-glycero-4-hexulose-5-epimerase